jgi:hypothetical protein
MSELNETARAFVSKATRYVERGVAEPAASEQYAFWLHFAIEPLLRGAVASVHPVLLADPRSDMSVLGALGVTTAPETVVRSRASGNLIKLLAAVDVQRFGPDFAARIDHFIGRRNIEAHTEDAAMAGVKAGWRDEFLRLASTLCDFIGIPPQQVLGDGLATLATQLTERDERAVQRELDRLLEIARAKNIGPVKPTGVLETHYVNGKVSRAFPCPACQNEAYLNGWPIRESDPFVADGDLVCRVTVASQNFECAHCELRLDDRPLVVAAGFPDVFETTTSVDPYEALTLDPTEEIERMGLHVVDPDWGYDKYHDD